jgi:hypothetical protein
MTRHVRQVIGENKVESLGRLRKSQTLRLDIVLPLRDPGKLDSFLAELYDPGRPGYRHFLSVQEFTCQFGQLSDSYRPVKGEPLNIHFNRDSSTNNLKTITVTCSGRNATRRLTAQVGLARSGEAETNQLVSLCRDVSR